MDPDSADRISFSVLCAVIHSTIGSVVMALDIDFSREFPFRFEYHFYRICITFDVGGTNQLIVKF